MYSMDGATQTGLYFIAILSGLLNPSPSTFDAEHTYWPDKDFVTLRSFSFCSSTSTTEEEESDSSFGVGLSSVPSRYHKMRQTQGRA